MAFNTSIEGAALTVEEVDAVPSVEGVNKIIFSNSTVTDNGDNSVTVDNAGVNTPGSSTDNALVRWDGTGGDTIQDSGVLLDDSNNIGIPSGSYAYFDGLAGNAWIRYDSGNGLTFNTPVGGPNFIFNTGTVEVTGNINLPQNDYKILMGTNSFGEIEYDGALDALLIKNSGLNKDIVFSVNDGGLERRITLNGEFFTLQSSVGFFDFDDDNIFTTGDVTATTFYNDSVVTFSDADATPTVTQSNVFLTANTGATTITDFDDPVDGQVIKIVFGDGNTTLEHGSNIKLTNGGNWTFSTDDAVTLVSSGGVWYEVGRAGGGSGSVSGPVSSTDNAIVRWNGAGGNLLQNSGIIIDDSDNITGVGTLSVSDDAYAASWNGSTEVPTKNALYDKINALETGLDWQDSVLDIQTDATLDPGASPTTGDRYIITDSAALHANFGTITGLGNNDIVQYDGSDFIVVYDVSVDTEGGSVWDEDSNNYYVYNGTAWVKWNTTLYTASDGVQLSSNDIKLDINGLTEFTGISPTADYLVYYDAAGDHKKITLNDLQAASRSSYNDGDIFFYDSGQPTNENAVAGFAFDNATNRLFLSRQDATPGILSGQFNIEYNTASYKGIALKQNGTQTHDFLYGESSGGTELFSVSALGGAYFGDSINVLGTVQGDEIQWDNGTSGSVLFLNGSKQIDEDNSNFFWDNTNKRLGIGEGTPTGFLHIAGASSGGGGTAHILLDKTDDSYSNLFTSQPFVNGDTLVFMTQAGSNGGFDWSGFSNSGGESGVYISGHTGASPTVPSIRLRGWKHDGGTDRTAVTGTEKIVGFLAGDTEVAYIDATGNIQSDAYTQGSVLFAGASGVISQNNSKFYWDDANENLGIGAAPNSETDLHVQRNGAALLRVETTDASERAFLQVRNTDTESWEFNIWGPSKAGTLFGINRANLAECISDTNAVLGTLTGKFLAFAAGNSEVARFTSAGNFGIGTTTPSALLQVAGDTVIDGDLTISGDDLFMATNTSGFLLVADGTNFNPVAMSGHATIDGTGAVTIDHGGINGLADDDHTQYSLISSQAGAPTSTPTRVGEVNIDTTSDNVYISTDTVSSGDWTQVNAGGGGISNVVEDTSPQLGGDLDTNSFNVLFDDAHGIFDENNNEQLLFQTTASATNYFEITNAATTGSPKLAVEGSDTDIDMSFQAKGTGTYKFYGTATSAAALHLYEDTDNGTNWVRLIAPAAIGSNSTLTLPEATDTLVGKATTDTFTNKSGNISMWTNDSGYITATLTNEEVEDIAGPLVATGGTKTGISITYQDATGDMDFVVSDTTVAGDTGSTGMTPGDTLTIAGGTEITTAMSGDTLTINADFTPSSTDTVTNKTIDGDNNTISNLDIGNEVDWAVITDVADRSAFASGDKLLIFEAGVGLRKIDYDDLPSGSGISNVVEDLTPQLGGDLDTNSRNILIDDLHGIFDESGNEQLKFRTTASAANYFEITNAATGNAPDLAAAGSDTNIDLNLSAKGTGVVKVAGSELEVAETAHFSSEIDNGNSGAADTIDWTAGNKQKSTLTGNCTYTFTAPSGPCNILLKVVQDATGSRTVTWPGTVKWPGGTAPTLSTAANSVDIVTFYYDGTNYHGVASLAFS